MFRPAERGHPEPFGLLEMLLRSRLAIQFRSVFLVFSCFSTQNLWGPLDPLDPPQTPLDFLLFFRLPQRLWTPPLKAPCTWTPAPPCAMLEMCWNLPLMIKSFFRPSGSNPEQWHEPGLS